MDSLKRLKVQLYKGGIRVPGIIRWPGKISPGGIITQPAFHADVMPTLCALVGVDAGSPLGIDLSPVLLGKKTALKDRRPLVWAGGGYGGQVAVRSDTMKVMRRNLFPGKKPANGEVYDISRAPSETHDLASSRRDLIEMAVSVLDKEYKPSPGFPALRYKAPEQTDK